MSTFPGKEADMYPIIADYFKDSLKCDRVYADDGSEVFLRLRKNLHFREVDVVALDNPDDQDAPIHLVEAKTFAKGHAFEECINQLDAIRDSGDLLWVAVPENEWESLEEKDRRRNTKRVRDHAFGLLLVSPTECSVEIKAPRNRDTDADARIEVLSYLGFAPEPLMPEVGSLSARDGKEAAGIMVLMCMVSDILFDLERKRPSFQDYFGDAYGKEHVAYGWYLPGVDLGDDVFCELDPFGCLSGDGVAVVWIGREIATEQIVASASFGTHIYVDNGDGWEWHLFPADDRSIAAKYRWRRGATETANLLQRVEIRGRTETAFREGLTQAIKNARRAAPKAVDAVP